MGEGLGVWLVPGPDGSIQLHMSQSAYVSVQVAGFLLTVVLGLATAWLVLP